MENYAEYLESILTASDTLQEASRELGSGYDSIDEKYKSWIVWWDAWGSYDEEISRFIRIAKTGDKKEQLQNLANILTEHRDKVVDFSLKLSEEVCNTFNVISQETESVAAETTSAIVDFGFDEL